MLGLFNSGVKGPVVPSKANREDKVVLGRVSQEKRPFWFVVQQSLGLVTVNFAPIERTIDNVTQARDKEVDIIDLGDHHGLSYR